MLPSTDVEYPDDSRRRSRSLEWVVPRFSGLVRCNVVPSVGLVNVNLTLKRKTGQPVQARSRTRGTQEPTVGCEPFLPYSGSAEWNAHPSSVGQSMKQYRLQFHGALNS